MPARRSGAAHKERRVSGSIPDGGAMIDEVKLRQLIADVLRQVLREELPKPNPPAPMFLTLKQAADVTQASVDTIRRAIARGTLPAATKGKRLIRIARSDLLAWMTEAAAKRGTVINMADVVKRLRDPGGKG